MSKRLLTPALVIRLSDIRGSRVIRLSDIRGSRVIRHILGSRVIKLSDIHGSSYWELYTWFHSYQDVSMWF